MHFNLNYEFEVVLLFAVESAVGFKSSTLTALDTKATFFIEIYVWGFYYTIYPVSISHNTDLFHLNHY